MANYFERAALDVTNPDLVGVGSGDTPAGDARICVSLGGVPTPAAVDGQGLDAAVVHADWIALTPAAARELHKLLEGNRHVWEAVTPIEEAAHLTEHAVDDILALKVFTVQVDGATCVNLRNVRERFREAERLAEMRTRAREIFPNAVFLPGDPPPPIGTRLMRLREDGTVAPFMGVTAGTFDGVYDGSSSPDDESSLRYWWRIKIPKVTSPSPLSDPHFDILLEYPPYLHLAPDADVVVEKTP